MNWHQPNALRNHYWESEKFDFWITKKSVYTYVDGENSEKWVLHNGDHQLGVYDTLEEAQNAAEPAHGCVEDKEADPICYWCGGIHLGEICANAPYYVKQ